MRLCMSTCISTSFLFHIPLGGADFEIIPTSKISPVSCHWARWIRFAPRARWSSVAGQPNRQYGKRRGQSHGINPAQAMQLWDTEAAVGELGCDVSLPPCPHQPALHSVIGELRQTRYWFWQRKLAQLLYLGVSPFCTWSRGLALNLKFPPTECIHIQLISNLPHSRVNKAKQHYHHIHMCMCHGVDYQVVQWPLTIWIFQLQYAPVYLLIKVLPDVYPLATPCSRVSISIFIRFCASCEYTHTKFIKKMFTSVSIPSTWTRAHLCMCTPRLFNPNTQNTCEQVTAKQNTYLCLHTNSYKMCTKK